MLYMTQFKNKKTIIYTHLEQDFPFKINKSINQSLNIFVCISDKKAKTHNKYK